MKYLSLVWASLFRKKTRAVLTLASLATAFLLFGLLQAVNILFGSAGDFVGTARLIVQARVSFTQPLPLRMLPQIESMPGVESVMYAQWFGGIYQDPQNFFAQFAVDPQRLFAAYPEWKLSAAERQTFINTRTGAIVGRRLAERFGWKVGDKVPLQSTIWPQQNGDKTWTFDIAGIFDGVDDEWQQRTNLMYLNFAYFDEARQFGNGSAGTYTIRLANPAQAAEVAAAIDRKFENSPEETKTQSERDFQLNFIKQIGDIGLIVSSILGAVFFTILLITGNTMAQAIRERIPELAILKTLGFTDRTVLGLVLGEALLLCLSGGLLGMGLAHFVIGAMGRQPGFPPVQASGTLWLEALTAMLVLGIAVGLLPAWRAMRLRIVDALAGH